MKLEPSISVFNIELEPSISVFNIELEPSISVFNIELEPSINVFNIELISHACMVHGNDGGGANQGNIHVHISQVFASVNQMHTNYIN